MFKTPFNGKIERVSIDFKEPSLTDDSFQDECDIGFIIENYLKTGQEPSQVQGTFIDCVSVSDYQTAQSVVAQAKSDFECLPSKIRDEFKTVENYLEFISKEDNLKTSIERGLLQPTTQDLAKIYPEKIAPTMYEVSAPASTEPVYSSSDAGVGVTPKSSVSEPVSS